MVSGRIALPEGAVYSEELNNFYGTQSQLMQSAKVRERAAAKVETLRPELQACNVSLNISQQQGTSFFVLQAIGDRGDYTQAYLDACMDEYIRFRRELQSMTHDTALTSIAEEVQKLRKDVEAGNEELLEFQKNNDIVFLEEEGNSAGAYLTQLNQRLTTLRSEFQLLSKLTLDQELERRSQNASTVESNDSLLPGATGPMGAEAEYIKAKQHLQVLKAEKARRSQFLRSKHPIIIDIDQQITQQERIIQLNEELGMANMANRRNLIKAEIESVETSIKEQRERALELQRRISEYTLRKAKVERAKSLSEKLLLGIQGIDMGKSLHADVVQVMEQASPSIATKLGLGRNLATGAVAGALVGLGLLFISMLLDDRIISADDLHERFQGEELLGQIPKESAKGRLSVLSLVEKQHVFAESYRNLRSTLHFMSFEDVRPKTFLVTSAVPGEGKSTVATNVAITIAAGGAKTLLIDGDLRKGVVHEFFSLEASPGLSDVFADHIPWKSVVSGTALNNLFVIARGRFVSGTSEHFLSQQTDLLLKEMYEEFDYIIFDSAPVLANDDTASLAPKIDATLFVVRSGVSSARLGRNALEALFRRQVNVLGLVLNAADGRSAEYYYYHKYGEYYSQAGID